MATGPAAIPRRRESPPTVAPGALVWASTGGIVASMSCAGPECAPPVASTHGRAGVPTTVNEQEPLPRAVAARAVARCALATGNLLAHRRTHLPKGLVGTRLHFADGTSARVFRETIVDGDPPSDPCLLVVEFRLRVLRGRWHALFLWECILNTPLFLGFPGFASKLWLGRDVKDRYRGFYQWHDAAGAAFYARSLWRVLELVCPPESIHYKVIPGFRRDDVLEDPQLLATVSPGEVDAWWRLIESA